jgi:hypothetical protein
MNVPRYLFPNALSRGDTGQTNFNRVKHGYAPSSVPGGHLTHQVRDGHLLACGYGDARPYTMSLSKHSEMEKTHNDDRPSDRFSTNSSQSWFGS